MEVEGRRSLRDAQFVPYHSEGHGRESLVRERIVNKFICGIMLAAALTVWDPIAPAAAERTAKPALLPPHEIITVVRSTGLVPLGQPVQRGNNYVLRARDDFGQLVRVVVDGRVGEVRSVVPVALGRGDGNRSDPPYPSIFDSGPPIRERRPPIDQPPILIEEDDAPTVLSPTPMDTPMDMPPDLLSPSAVRRLPPPISAPELVPPEVVTPHILTVPRPPGDVSISPPNAPSPESETEDTVLLPPPPPRFPQRPPPSSVKAPPKAAPADTKTNRAKKADAKKPEPEASQRPDPSPPDTPKR
jgi:hypothetical protein